MSCAMSIRLRQKGADRIERVRYRVEGREQVVAAELLLLHQGVVPNINLSNAIGCEHEWDERLHCCARVSMGGARAVFRDLDRR